MTIRATRVPATTGGARTGPPSVRYDVPEPWSHVTAGHDARCQCTRAWRDGAMRLKYVNAMCPNLLGAHRG
jgi:hypothetical protein